jgi:hypothetical protein
MKKIVGIKNKKIKKLEETVTYPFSFFLSFFEREL